MEGYSYHSLALRSDGTVWAWGTNYYGQLGNGTTVSSSEPVQVSGLSNVVAVATRAYHSLALRSDGTVWAWGSNWYGELGNGTSLPFPDVGSNVPVQVIGLSSVVAIAAGNGHSVALLKNGSIYTWGNNFFGELGWGTIGGNTTRPAVVPGFSNAVAIATGDGHTLAIKSDGTVWAWGYNGCGQLGSNGTTNSGVPLEVPGLSNAIAITGGGPSGAGAVTSMALTSNGTVLDWGLDAIGLGSLSNIVAIAGGGDGSLAVRSDNTVWQWGMSNSSLYAPVQVAVPAPPYFQIVTNGIGPGTITPSSSTVYEGLSATFTITPAAGNTLQSLNDNGTDVTQGITWNANETVYTYTISHVMSNRTIQATFGVPFELSSSSAGNGTITSSSSSADYGSSITFTITPAAKYALATLTDDGVDVTGAAVWNASQGVYLYTISDVTSNHTVGATFSLGTPGGTASPVPALSTPMTALLIFGLAGILWLRGKKRQNQRPTS